MISLLRTSGSARSGYLLRTGPSAGGLRDGETQAPRSAPRHRRVLVLSSPEGRGDGGVRARSGRLLVETASARSPAVDRHGDLAGGGIVARSRPAGASASTPPFAANPGLGSAFTLCLVHAFLLPSLLTRPGPKLSRLLRALLAGAVGAPLALVLGLAAGVMTDAIAIAMLGLISPASGAAYQPHSEWVLAAENAAGTGPLERLHHRDDRRGAERCGKGGRGSGAPRPRSLWRVALAGACASLVSIPDWWLQGLRPPLREPVLLGLAALPMLLILGRSALDQGARPLDSDDAGRADEMNVQVTGARS